MVFHLELQHSVIVSKPHPGAIGFGVPLLWIFLGAQFYGKTGAVNGPVAAFIGTGILVSYYGLLLVASWVRARMLKRQTGRPQRLTGRDPWNRSMRDTPYKPGEQQSDPVERLFVATAIVSLTNRSRSSRPCW